MPTAEAHAQIGAVAGLATYTSMSVSYDRKMEVGEAALCVFTGTASLRYPT